MIHNPNNPVWIDHIWFIIEIDDRDAANTAGILDEQLFPSDTGNPWTNAAELSVDGQEPATHLMLASLVRQPMVDSLPGFKASFTGSDYWRERDGWTNKLVMADSGLKQIEVEIDA